MVYEEGRDYPSNSICYTSSRSRENLTPLLRSSPTACFLLLNLKQVIVMDQCLNAKILLDTSNPSPFSSLHRPTHPIYNHPTIFKPDLPPLPQSILHLSDEHPPQTLLLATSTRRSYARANALRPRTIQPRRCSKHP